MTPYHLYIVDDHQLVIDGLENILNNTDDLKLIGSANDGKRGAEMVDALKPDLVLMDIDMPVLNGIDAAREILSKNPDQKIMMLSMYGERSLLERLMKLGIQGFLLKNTDKEELLQGIYRVLKGKKYYQAELLEGVVSGKAPELNNQQLALMQRLSQRETEVLKLIAQGMTSKEIAEKLFLASRTVETHRKNIHAKLEVKHMAGLIRFAIKAGMVD